MMDEPGEFEPVESGSRALVCRVLVAGFGPVGRVVTERLESAGVRVGIIETNLTTIEQQLALGRPISYGDVRDRQVLLKAGIEQADALILTIPDEDVALEACQLARRIRPDLFIAARTNYLSKGMLATRLGADAVVVEEVVTAEAMQHAVMERLIHKRS